MWFFGENWSDFGSLGILQRTGEEHNKRANIILMANFVEDVIKAVSVGILFYL